MIGGDSLYKGVDNQIIKYIHGSPNRVFTLGIKIVVANNKEMFQVRVMNPNFNKQICTIEIPEERVFKDILPANISGKDFE